MKKLIKMLSIKDMIKMTKLLDLKSIPTSILELENTEFMCEIAESGWAYLENALVIRPIYFECVNHFEKDQKVLVWDNNGEIKSKRYYSHFEPKENRHVTFVNGKTSWSSGGITSSWNFCEEAKDE